MMLYVCLLADTCVCVCVHLCVKSVSSLDQPAFLFIVLIIVLRTTNNTTEHSLPFEVLCVFAAFGSYVACCLSSVHPSLCPNGTGVNVGSCCDTQQHDFHMLEYLLMTQ